MKKRVIMFLIASVISVSMININSISAKAITQDEMVEMMKQACEENGINFEDAKTTGGTANDNLTEDDLKKAENIAKGTVTPVVEPTKEVETTEEITITEEETSTEESTTIEEPTTTEEETTTVEVVEPTKKMNIAVFVIIFIVVVIGLAVFGILHKKNGKH